MIELNEIEISEISGCGPVGKVIAFAGIYEAAKDFLKGFIDGVKAGYNA